MTVVGAHRPSAATVSRTLLAILASGPLCDSSGLAIFLRLDPRVGPLWPGLLLACAVVLLSTAAKSRCPLSLASWPWWSSVLSSLLLSSRRRPSAAALLRHRAALLLRKSYRLVTVAVLCWRLRDGRAIY
jgi:hypothetical protein